MSFEAKIYPNKEWKIPTEPSSKPYNIHGRPQWKTRNMNSTKAMLELKKSLEKENNKVEIVQAKDYTIIKTVEK